MTKNNGTIPTLPSLEILNLIDTELGQFLILVQVRVELLQTK